MSDWLDTITGLLGIKGSSGGSSNTPSILPDLIKAGSSLAQSYFQQSNDRSLAEQYAAQQASANKVEKDKTLADLYARWAATRQVAGHDAASTALATGKNMTDALNARAYVLK